MKKTNKQPNSRVYPLVAIVFLDKWRRETCQQTIPDAMIDFGYSALMAYYIYTAPHYAFWKKK